MWPRTVEFMIGCWLLMSPFVFRSQNGDVYEWVGSLGGGSLLIVLSLSSFWGPTVNARLLTPVLGVALVVLAWLESHPLPPALQNHIIVGFLIAMTGVIPNNALLPPEGWREYEARASDPEGAEMRATKQTTTAA